jgi:hypothetical protein
LRKQGNASVCHGSVYVHEEQLDVRGALLKSRGDFG